MVPFSFASEEMRLVAGRALYWPREKALLVADLHLEKASHFARLGQMLPPYDSRETLARLAEAIRQSGARRVFCLGDSFHDGEGAGRMDPHAAGMLDALCRMTDWVWIAGNHDCASAPGEVLEELELCGLVLRHEADPDERRSELSGHFHPRLRISMRGRRVVRPCAVATQDKLVLPAFGALTGGMDAADPSIRKALGNAGRAEALVEAKGRLLRFALWEEHKAIGARIANPPFALFGESH